MENINTISIYGEKFNQNYEAQCQLLQLLNSLNEIERTYTIQKACDYDQNVS